ncbi:MAG TPA: type II toxin-antitoxin system RelE/ParE family toxin [Pirellulales bacterium]|nr:type II toxin-antitoxin system RelE/ParE family toxin [Pirellulales bacterium]
MTEERYSNIVIKGVLMPETQVAVFRDKDGSIPLQAWFESLEAQCPKAFEKLAARILLLSRFGHELRRPHADFLRDGVYELRERLMKVQYRVLYFFHGQNMAVLSHGLTKEGKVPDKEINKAIRNRALVALDSDRHTADWEA